VIQRIEEYGFSIFENLFSSDEVASLLGNLADSGGGRAGIRHALSDPNVFRLAHDPRLIEIAHEVLGSTAFPFRATFFSKTAKANWLVVWHQDTALPIRERRGTRGWGPWSVKAGISYAHAPTSALERVLALRVHLDDCVATNGPLRVLPETHKLGVLTDDVVHELAQQLSPVNCLVPRGGVLAMRPLLIHSSSKSKGQSPRRVLHIEYAASIVTHGGLELAVV
jgi:ectoine hydroxylase-related dioxygenase (phytanoyl-CoA dioxygenase family)